MEAGFTVQRFNQLLSWWEAWLCTGRLGTGEVTESSSSGCADRKKRERH